MKIIGNSHTASLRDGLALVDESLREQFEVKGSRGRFEKAVFFEATAQGVLITEPDLARRVEAISGNAVIAPGTDWGFCLGHPGFLFNVQGWRHHKTSEIAARSCSNGKQPISLGVLRAFVEATFANVLGFFEAVAQAGVAFVVILAPPPRRNVSAIRNMGVAVEQVVSIDRMGRTILTEKARTLGVPVVDAPPESVDAQGFLRSEFCAGRREDGREDPHHANAHYGRLMLQRIAAVRSTAVRI